MGLNYTNLGITGQGADKWHNIHLSENTIARRNMIRNGIDDFASFTWRGVDAFDTFGAFIINNKNSLKFYNGPTYSNSYTKPQFDSAYGQLTGITFNVQKIDFTIGVYWISEEHYRQLIYWLNPYEVNTLTFRFEPEYYYQVKLASIEDGIRYVVGHEENKPMYYTEMKLSFEVQGPACAYHIAEYRLDQSNSDEDSLDQWREYAFQATQENTKNSDLAIPIECLANLKLVCGSEALPEQDRYIVDLFAQYGNNEPINLFSVTFKNQTYSQNSSTANILSIKYESDSGLLLLNVGDSEYMLLNQLSTSNYGKRIIESITVNKFEIPGTFDDPNFDMLHNLKFTLNVNGNMGGAGNWIATKDDVHFKIRARTNLI